MARVKSGLDIFIERKTHTLRGKRVGLICHQASVDSKLRHAVGLLREKHVHLTALFAPEHGMWGTAQDQIPINDSNAEFGARSAAVGSSSMRTPSSAFRVPRSELIPVVSLYGDHRHPSPESLQKVDILICDLQDVGSRYYTFVWTMALAMQACAKAGKKFVVLDRPNPINGKSLEGPVLDPTYASFVGLYPVPVRHGLTIGEIALWL